MTPVKFWPVFSYLIIYDPATRPIGIARVLHASRDLGTMLRHAAPRVSEEQDAFGDYDEVS